MQARVLYEEFYCARGEMENRIKEQQLGLFADRTSTAYMRSNQLRLYFSSIAYCLMEALRRLGLKDTDMARALDHPLTAAQDWRPDSHHGTAHLDLHGRRSPRSERIRASLAQLATRSLAGLKTPEVRLGQNT